VLTEVVLGMVRPEGLEPPAYRFEACRSIQLSYGRVRNECSSPPPMDHVFEPSGLPPSLPADACPSAANSPADSIIRPAQRRMRCRTWNTSRIRSPADSFVARQWPC
jgi:hypothetical protein